MLRPHIVGLAIAKATLGNLDFSNNQRKDWDCAESLLSRAVNDSCKSNGLSCTMKRWLESPSRLGTGAGGAWDLCWVNSTTATIEATATEYDSQNWTNSTFLTRQQHGLPVMGSSCWAGFLHWNCVIANEILVIQHNTSVYDTRALWLLFTCWFCFCVLRFFRYSSKLCSLQKIAEELATFQSCATFAPSKS
jgi:hypothetical protein